MDSTQCAEPLQASCGHCRAHSVRDDIPGKIKITTKLLILELLGGIFGLIRFGAAIAAVYFLYGALANDAPWSGLLWSIGAGFIAKYFATAMNRNEQRVAYVEQLMERGYTRTQATTAWHTAINSGSSLLLNLQQAEKIEEVDGPDPGSSYPDEEKSDISDG